MWRLAETCGDWGEGETEGAPEEPAHRVGLEGGAQAARQRGGQGPGPQQHQARGTRQGDHPQGPRPRARRSEEGAADQNPGIPSSAA